MSDQSDEDDLGFDDEDGVKTLTRPKEKIKKPSLYKVVLLNDDFTPMDFVILVIKKFFSKTEGQATQIMLDVHKKGAGICGVYSFEIAETKVHMVNSFSKNNKHPLKCDLERE